MITKFNIEPSPNPDVLVFNSKELSNDIDQVITVPGDGIYSPFFEELNKRLPFIKGIYIHSNSIAVLKDNSDTREWGDIFDEVEVVMVDLFNEGLELYTDVVINSVEYKPGSVELKIYELIRERIRPAILSDGGDIEFKSFKDGVAYIELQGACSGCPSSSATLRVGIKRILTHFVDEVVDVEDVNNL